MSFLTAFIVLGVLQTIKSESTSALSAIGILRKDILNGYDVNARPVRNHYNRTEVTVGFRPVHITEVNENRGILTLEGWVYMAWFDDHLKWEPKKYSGLDSVRLSEKEVWKPDITIWEGRGNQLRPWHSKNLEVNSSGYVEWSPAATMQVYCGDFDYEQYPEDTQSCTITFGTWTQDIKNVDLQIKTDNETFSEFSSQNPHWELTNLSASREERPYEAEDDVYASIEFELEITRQHVPHSALGNVPGSVARVLILSMFWVTNFTRKLLLGCTSLLILSTIAVGITVTLPSPAAATYALYEVSAALTICVIAIQVEIAFNGLSECTLSLPSWMESVSQSSFFRFLSLCQIPKKSSKEDRQGIIQNEDPKDTFWPVLAIILDRVAFAVFAVILLAM